MKSTRQYKKGIANVAPLAAFVLGVVILALVSGIGGLIITNMANTVYQQGGGSQNGSAFNITNQGNGFNGTWNATMSSLQGITNVGQQIPLVALIGVMAFIIGVVIVAFSFRGNAGV